MELATYRMIITYRMVITKIKRLNFKGLCSAGLEKPFNRLELNYNDFLQSIKATIYHIYKLNAQSNDEFNEKRFSLI